MDRVWVVTYLDDFSYEVAASEEIAFSLLEDYIRSSKYIEQDAALNELNESFKEDPEQFGVEDVGWAKASEIYGLL